MDFATLGTRFQEGRALTRALPGLVRCRPGSPWSASKLLEERAAKHPDRHGLAYGERLWTWRDIDAEVNRTARALQREGVGVGDVVTLLMDNRPEFVFVVNALSRLRAIAALLNTHIAGPALVHAVRVAGPKRLVVGSEHAEKLARVLPELTEFSEKDVFEQGEPEAGRRFTCFDERVAAESSEPPVGTSPSRIDERFAYIYTSGTTGLPKAAIITNQRFLSAGALMGGSIFELGPEEVMYVPLPLYHSAGLFGGWAGALLSGACMAFRPRFSASGFWDDVRRFGCTRFIYIGELCRYLLNQPERPGERRHDLKIIGGNGLRPDIWREFQTRFGIPLIREYYGSTEGPMPMVNLTGREGMVGRLLPGNVVVHCDLETGEIRPGPDGRCEKVEQGETGLLLSRIAGAGRYDGYVDEEATRKKVREGVFRDADQYFDTGDLVVLNDDGWISFADRVGDTFRWKGENVSTNEVAELLNGAPGVLESNVYGVQVPNTEGRAGMASLHVGDPFSIEAFGRFVTENLPGFQRPYFLRVQREMRITGTFKHQKVDYRKEGYDPAQVDDPLYFLDGAEYVPLDAERYEAIRSGSISLR